MKPKFRHLRSLAIASSVMLTISYSHAQSGTWLGDNAGNWTDSANWTGAIIADAADNTATFGNTITADRIITLNGDRTIGNITASDTTHNYTISGANILTLDRTSLAPIIDVTTSGRTLSISSEVAGLDGLRKNGLGALLLSGVNTYTGTTTINAGTLTLNSQTGSLATTTPLTFSGTGTFNMDNVGASGALTQTLGALSFSAGQGTVQITRTAAFDQAITFTSLAARTAGASGNFVNVGGTNSATNGFIFTAAPTAGALIDRGIFFNGSAYATYDVGGFVRGFTVGDTNYLAAPTGATIGASVATSNVDLTTGNITAQTTVAANTINMRANSIAMTGTNQVLSTNGILSSGSGSATIGGGTTPFLQAASSGGEMVIRVNGASDQLTINSTLRNNTTASSVTKTGAGRLVLNAATFTGALNVNAGTLDAAFTPTYSSANLAAGATWNYLNAFGNNPAFNVPFTIDGNFIKTGNGSMTFNSGATISGSGSLSFSGQVTIIINSNNPNFTGTITDTTQAGSGFQLNNNGALGAGLFVMGSTNAISSSVGGGYVAAYNSSYQFNGNQTFGGSNNLNFGSGAVTLNSSPTLTINNTQTTFGGAIGQTGGIRSLTKAGAGILVLSGADSTYSGGTNINAGTLRLGASNVLLNAGSVAVGGGTFDIQTFSDTVGAVTMTSGSITGTSGVLTGSSFNVQSGSVSAILAGAGAALSKTTTGSVTLSGSNTYGGGTTITTGTLQFANTAAMPATGLVAVGTGATLAVNAGAASAEFTNATSGNGSIGGLLAGLGGQTGGTVSYTGAVALGIDTTNATAGTMTYSGVIGNVGTSLGLTKLGTGTLVLDQANTYTGATSITAGTLSLTGSLSGGGAVSTSGTGILNQSAAGVISGRSTFTQASSGTSILTGTNTYSGATTITTGTLQLGSGTATGSLNINSAISIGTGATFAVNQSDTVTQGTDFSSAPITGAGNFLQSGSGTTVLNLANTFSGTTTVSVGTLTLTNALALQNSALVTTSGTSTISGTGSSLTVGGLSGASGDLGSANVLSGYTGTVTALTLNPQTGVSVTYGGVISDGSGAMSLTKTGAGTQRLQGTNTYTGATNINAGTLTLSGASGSLASTAINLNGGTLTLDNSSGTGNSGARVSDSATVTVNQSSALNFTHNAAAATNYSETIDTLSLVDDFLTYTGSLAASGQTSNLHFNTLSRSGASNTSTVNFAGTGLGTNTRNTITFSAGVTDATDLGPWAVINGADFASYSTANGIVAATSSTLAVGSNSSTTNFNTTAGSITFNAALNPSLKTLLVTGGTARTTALNGNTVSVGGISSTGANHIISGTGALQAPTAGDALYAHVGANQLTISSIIQNVGASATPSAFVKSGAGTLVLLRDSGSNTYTGATTLSAGTLQGNTGTSLISAIANPFGTSALQLNGGTLQLRSDSSFSSGSAAGTIAWNNNTTVGGNVTINVARVTGSGSNKIHQLGTLSIGAHTLTASDNSSENHDLRFGATTLTGNAVFDVVQGGGAMNLTLGAVGDGISDYSLTKSGAASLEINGNSTLSGGLVVNAGTLNLTGTQSFSGGVTLNGGSLGQDTNGISAAELNNNSITVSGSATFKVTSGETLTSSSSIAINSPNTLTIGPANGGSFTANGAVTGSGVLALGNGNTNSHSVVTLASNANTFTGNVTYTNTQGGSADTMLLVNSFGDAGKVTFGGNANDATFGLNSTATAGLTFNTRQFELTGGNNVLYRILNNSAQAFTINSNLDASTASGTKVLTLGGSGAGSSTFAGLISNGGSTLSISKAASNSGAGGIANDTSTNTWNLTNASNSYTGGTTVSAGTLGFVSGALGTTGTINASGGTLLWLSGNTQDISSRLAMTAATTSTHNTNGNNVTFASAIGSSASGALTKAGLGTLTLQASSTYSGTTTVNLGTLAGTQTSGTPVGTGAVALNAGTLSLAPTGTGADVAVTGGNIANTNNFTFNADSVFSLNKGTNNSLTYTFSRTNAAAGFTRGTNGTMILSVGDIDNLGNTVVGGGERFLVTAAAAPVTLVNTLVSGVVAQDRSNSNAGDFVTYGVTNGFAKATYTLTNTLVGSTNTSVVDIASPTSTGTIAAYAVKVSGTTLTNSGTLTLGNGANTAGLILNSGTISGGTLTTPAAAAEFVIYTSGTSAISSAIPTATGMIGMSVFGPGTLDFSSSSGNTFTGGLRINNSTVIATNNNQLGGTTSDITLTGGTLQTSGTVALGAATGQRNIILNAGQNQTGGTFNVTADTTTFTSTTSKLISGSGSLTKTGTGILALATNVATTNSYTGGTFVNDGTLRLDAANMLADTGAVTVGGGTFAIQGNNDTVGAVTLTGGFITGTTGVLTGTSYAVQAGEISAILGGTNVALTKTTVGTVTLGGANTYTGTTTVSGGTLLVNNTTGSGTGTNTVSVASGATLGGTGAITGAVNVSGVLSPGASIESLATGALTMASGSTFVYEVANETATGADMLGVNGALSLTNVNLSLDLATIAALSLPDTTWTVGDKLTLISYTGTGITSGFAGYTDDNTYNFGDNVWRFNYNDTVAGGNYGADAIIAGQTNFVTLTALTVIPEPSSVALLGTLGAMMLLRRRR